MNFKELYEGVEPTMPGAPKGIQIMTPQQFVAKSGDMPGEESEEGVAEGTAQTFAGKDPMSFKSPKGGTPTMMIVTGQGSRYLITSDGMVLRNKSFHANTGGEDQGLKNWSDAIEFYDPTERPGGTTFPMTVAKAVEKRLPVGLSKTKDGKRALLIHDGSQWRVAKISDVYKHVATTDEPIVSTYSTTPKLNWNVLDYTMNSNNTFKSVHPGSPVTHGIRLGQQGVAEAKAKTQKKEVVGFTSESEFKTWEQYAQKEGYEIREAGNLPGSYAAFDDNGKRVGYFFNKFDLPNGYYYVGELVITSVEQGEAEAVTPASVSKVLRLIQRHHSDWFDTYGMGEVEDAVVDMAKMGQFRGTSAAVALKLVRDELESMYGQQGVAEGLEHLNRIRKLSGLDEATTLPASTRDLKGQEFQDYMNRIKGTDDIDKKTGQVKLDKKGNEKYVSGKTKGDKYKMPYIHRSSIIEYLGPDGKTYDEDKIKQSLSQRPKSLLKQNEKMKHSNGEFEQFFNVGFAALTGIAVDEQTNNLIIVNTCPGAGSCKVDCFAMKGGKVQFKAAWQSDGRILTYLLNDPSGFFNQLSSEISKEEQLGQRGDKKFPNGWKTTIRWHDAGDFFSPEYLDMALKMAAKHPDTKFYAYTKMAGAALAQKPPNFIINWSEGANTSQEKQVKAKDANLDTTKNSRIVPDDLFQDLLVKDEKKNLVKGASGQWQVQPDKLPELKQRLASEYGLSANSILSYDEYMAKRKSIPQGMKYNVIVAPGEGDISANDPNIISTLLLRH